MIHLAGYLVHQLLRETVDSHIYRGTSKADKRAVAIKVARESSPQVHAAARQELEIIRKLDGLAVVRGVELIDFEDRPALVMDLVAGGGIDYWQDGRPLALGEFLQIAIAVAHALAGIHDRGVIHRDLKPSNILINPDTLEICIADFGVAASLDGAMSIQAAAMVGSLAYLSPEQTGRMNRRVDSRSDLYSFGVTLYELITGVLPFECASPLELVHAHFALMPVSPSERDPRIPAVISELIGKLLAKGPDDRYQSAEGVLADLRTIAAQRAADQPLGGFRLGGTDRARAFLLPSKLYGRTVELALIDRCIASAHSGVTELLAIGGASGAGKTALFAEAEHRLAAEGGHFIKGKFDQLARNVPFSAVSQAIADLVDQLLAKTDRELGAIRTELVDELAGLGQVMIEIAPSVEKVIGAQPAVPALGLRESQARLADVFWRFISALATSERPLVMMLDDLQWADSGSLALLDALVEDGRHTRRRVALLVLAAYRENELPASHPFRKLLDRLSHGSTPDGASSGSRVAAHELVLRPLEVGHVAELLGDTLRMPLASVGALADIVFRRTSGNAFFVHQFLGHAHRLGLFRFTAEGWHWDLEAIRTAGIPDDAVGLMTERIRALAPSIQRIVIDASVIGDELDLPTLLAATTADADEVLRAIHVLVEDGVLVPAGHGYRFAHDKIREAALGLATGDHVSRIHVAVGRHRLQALGPGDSSATIFAIADHLNHGHLQLSAAERIDVAALNLRAGKQALGVGAVTTAVRYFTAGLALLDGTDPWHTHFQLMFELTLEHAHTRFYCGDAEAALAAFDMLRERELSLPNLAAVYLRLIAARVSREEFEAAARDGIAALAAFGVRIPLRLKPGAAALAAVKAMWKMGDRPEALLELPASTDAVARARHQLITAIAFPLYNFDPNLAGIATLVTVPKLLEDGVDASSPMELLSYALSLQIRLGKPALAHRFTRVASELHQRHGSPRDTPNLLFRRYQLLEPWHAPYRESIEPFELAIEKAHDVGDRLSVVVCHVCRLLCAITEGVQLSRVERMIEEATDSCLRSGLPNQVGAFVSLRDATRQLRDQPVDAPTDWFASPTARELDPRQIQFYIAVNAQILVRLVRGDHDAAFALSERIWPALFKVARGVVFVWIACVAIGIGAAIRLPAARGKDRRRYRKLLASAIDKLRKWAVHNPVSFAHKALWLEAERARAQGRNQLAMTLYLEAREGALAAEYPHIAAAIDLRCGELAVELGMPSEAALRFQAAIQAVRAWGARAVASHLEQRYASHVFADQAAPAAKPDAGHRDSHRATGIVHRDTLDFGALISASQAIAREVTLGPVLERVMANTMASAGATLGVLLLERGGELIVEVRQRAGGKLERGATPLAHDDDLPRSIVQYVHHSGETVVLADAATAGRFVADPWVRSHAAKSILCAPIVKQARTVGVLLLHNDLVSNAFTDRHLTTLQMLSTQAAISIDNAILYDELSTLNRELEARVEDRTRALRQAQEQLIESARKAGMADVAVEVLHNVGNALNSVNVSAQLVHGRLADSKVKTLTRVAAMLDDHKDHLVEFLARDPRGQKIAPMLSVLSTALVSEHEDMLGELVRLRHNLDNVGVVVHELDVTAANKGIAALEAPHLLIAETAALVIERGQRANVAIVVDAPELTGTRIDKHRGREIVSGLLANALDALEPATVDHKQIQVTVRAGSGTAVIQIIDNGVGIPRENLTRIFHRGFSNKPDRRGASLHRFANLATSVGGSLSVDSDGPGCGATFTLVLPNATATRSTAA